MGGFVLGMTNRQLATSAVAAAVGVLVAVAGVAGRTDLAVGGLGLLLAGVLVMLIDIRRRQGDIARRVRQVARRQALDSKRIGWLRSMPKNVKKEVKTALRPAVTSLGDTVDRAVGHIQAAGDGVSAGLAQERLAAAERHVRLTDDLGALAAGVSDVRADLGGVRTGVDDVRADLDGVRAGITEAKDGIVARIDESDQDDKRRQVSLRGQVSKLAYEPVRQIQALLQLVNRYDARAPLPPTGGWAMEPSTILHLVRMVEQTRPGLIVECGSGASSVWLAYAAEAYGGRLVSLEHDERFAEQTRQLLHEHGLTANTDVRSAPLTELKLGQETFQWYDTAAVGELDGIGLLLVDGPPRASGPRARYPAVPVLGPKLSVGARVVIDDVDRAEEQEAAEAWLAEFPGLEREGSSADRSATLIYRPA